MRVFTYYSPVAGLHGDLQLIDLWKRVWSANGWEPTVLGEKDAMRHERFQKFHETVFKLPSINAKEYEMACYLRHLAMAEVGGGLAVDYDVFPYGFTPQKAKEIVKVFTAQQRQPPTLLLLEPTRVPCAIIGTRQGYLDLCDRLENYRPGPADIERGRPHVSDMTIIRKSDLPALPVCIEHLCSGSSKPNDPGDGWKTAFMVHYSSQSFKSLEARSKKHELIRRCRSL